MFALDAHENIATGEVRSLSPLSFYFLCYNYTTSRSGVPYILNPTLPLKTITISHNSYFFISPYFTFLCPFLTFSFLKKKHKLR